MTDTAIVSTALAKITEIYDEYCGSETTQDQLKSWINKCITHTIKESCQTKKVFRYEEARIEYFKDILLFSIIKSEYDSEGDLTGITYDISISIKPYLIAFFGTDHIPVLREAGYLLDDELIDLSSQVSDDIDAWCKNVECVFSVIGNIS